MNLILLTSFVIISLNLTEDLGFTGLTLHNLHIEHCGGILTPTAVSSINQSRVYFPIGQTAVLLISQCYDIILSNLTINGLYFGYAIIIVNVYGIVHMTDISVSNSFKCSYITYALLRGNNPSLLLLLHLVFLAPFTFIQVYYKPYRGKWVNIFECVILIDLLLLEFITLYGQLKGDVSITEPYITEPYISVLMLLILVLLILISLIGWHCIRYMTRYKAGRKIRDYLKKKKKKIISKFQKEYQEDEDLLERLIDDC